MTNQKWWSWSCPRHCRTRVTPARIAAIATLLGWLAALIRRRAALLAALGRDEEQGRSHVSDALQGSHQGDGSDPVSRHFGRRSVTISGRSRILNARSNILVNARSSRVSIEIVSKRVPGVGFFNVHVFGGSHPLRSQEELGPDALDLVLRVG